MRICWEIRPRYDRERSLEKNPFQRLMLHLQTCPNSNVTLWYTRVKCRICGLVRLRMWRFKAFSSQRVHRSAAQSRNSSIKRKRKTPTFHLLRKFRKISDRRKKSSRNWENLQGAQASRLIEIDPDWSIHPDWSRLIPIDLTPSDSSPIDWSRLIPIDWSDGIRIDPIGSRWITPDWSRLIPIDPECNATHLGKGCAEFMHYVIFRAL